MQRPFVTLLLLLPALGSVALAQTQPGDPAATAAPAAADEVVADRYTLVEEFTADTLAPGEVEFGTELDIGLPHHLMIGTDLVAAAIGALTIEGKWEVWRSGPDAVALGLRAAYLSKKTLLAWGTLRDTFSTLDARIVRPSVSWTDTVSPRLKLHTFWAMGFGPVDAGLSPTGVRDLWEAKHPGQNYANRNQATGAPGGAASANSSANQALAGSEQDSPTADTIEVESIAGLAQDRFQLTGEYSRLNGNKILVTTDIEQNQLEQLKSTFTRLTIAHQWIWQTFQMRLGVGVQYYVMTGTDLDGEQLDQSGWQPAADIAFYWRF